MFPVIEKWEDAGEWTREAMKGKPLSPYLHALFFALRERYHAAGRQWNNYYDDIIFLNFEEPLTLMKFIAAQTENLINLQKFTSKKIITNTNYIGFVYSIEGIVWECCTSTKQNILNAINETEWYDLNKKKLHFYEADFFIFYKKVLDCMTEVFLRKSEADTMPQTLLTIAIQESSGWQFDSGEFYRVMLGIVQDFVPENNISLYNNYMDGWAGSALYNQFYSSDPNSVLAAINAIPGDLNNLEAWMVDNQYYNFAKNILLNSAPTYQGNNNQDDYHCVGELSAYRYNRHNEYHYPGDEYTPPEDREWLETGCEYFFSRVAMNVPESKTTFILKPDVDRDCNVNFYNFTSESFAAPGQYHGTKHSSFKFFQKNMLSEGIETLYDANKTYLKYAISAGMNWQTELSKNFIKIESRNQPAVIIENEFSENNYILKSIYYEYYERVAEIATYQPDFKFLPSE